MYGVLSHRNHCTRFKVDWRLATLAIVVGLWASISNSALAQTSADGCSVP